MFRRVTALVLILSTLGYGSAWAFVLHAGETGDHEHVLEHKDADPGGDADACDHCCHAAAHLIGIPPGASVVHCRVRGAYLLPVNFLAVTREYAPPHKPPRS